jgi:hypothetical protein
MDGPSSSPRPPRRFAEQSSCTGVLYLSQGMRDAGLGPVCIGVQRDTGCEGRIDLFEHHEHRDLEVGRRLLPEGPRCVTALIWPGQPALALLCGAAGSLFIW